MPPTGAGTVRWRRTPRRAYATSSPRAITRTISVAWISRFRRTQDALAMARSRATRRRSPAKARRRKGSNLWWLVGGGWLVTYHLPPTTYHLPPPPPSHARAPLGLNPGLD